VDIPRVKTTTYGKKSFRYAAAEMGNSLPDHFRTENSFSQSGDKKSYKTQISEALGISYMHKAT
jgi:hypothetical protein